MSFNKNIRCPDCNYCNHYEMIKLYGTCKLCGKVLDKKQNINMKCIRNYIYGLKGKIDY